MFQGATPRSANPFGVKPWKPHGALNSCLDVRFRRCFVESCPKLASEWLQIGFKVAGIQKWLQNGFKIKLTWGQARRARPLVVVVCIISKQFRSHVGMPATFKPI